MSKKKKIVLIIFGIFALTVGLTVISVLAVHDLELFELDRNAIDTGDPGDDWDSLKTGGGTAEGFSGILPDIGSDGGTQFHGGGSKDDLPISSWRWNPGEPLDKDDITNAYAAAYVYGGPEVCPDGFNPGDDECTEDGDLIIYFGLDRYSNNGSAQVGFWFFQSPVGLTSNSSKGGFEFSGSHAIGDILVQSNFSNGGVISDISIYEWVGSGGSDGSLDLVYSAQDCVGGADPYDQACATVNQGDTASPWAYTPKFGTVGTFPAGSFFEGGINLSSLVPGAGCFSGFLAETRSSTPFDSRLKDFVLGNLSVCYIEGIKYLDVNGNGQWDDGEDYLNDWTINLSDGQSAVTGDGFFENGTPWPDGYYRFDNIANGAYTVSEVCPSPDPVWVQSEPYLAGVPYCGDGVYNFNINLDNRVGIGNFGNGVPDVTISKTCDADVFVGDDINYTITVTNTGTVDLFDLEIADTLLGPLGTLTTLAAGDSQSYMPTYTATSAGTVDNTASVVGYYPDHVENVVAFQASSSDDCTTNVHELTVTKNADEFYRRYYSWEITKSVVPAAWSLFSGETATSQYTVVLDQTGYIENDWLVTGAITISNPAPIDATLTQVLDDAGGVSAVVDCDPVTEGAQNFGTVPAEGSLVCSYDSGEQDFEDSNPFGDTNTATATLSNNGGGTTDFAGTTDIDFTEAIVEEVDEEASVIDTYAGSTVGGTWTGDKTFTYSRDFSCDGDAGEHNNTASFETNDTPLTGSDNATVTVNCYDLDVTKTADEFFTRYYEWDITKSVTPESWDLFTGESGTSEYTVILDRSEPTENDWQVKGKIWIANNHTSRVAVINGVVDDAGGITGVVSCPPGDIPPGGIKECTYDTGAQDAEDANPFGSTNTATATQQLYDFAYDLSTTADGTKNYSGTATIDFSTATVTLVDDQATVSDTYPSSTVGGTHSSDQTWTYSRTFACDDDEGQHDNTASFVTNTTSTTGSDDASVDVNCYTLAVTKTADEFYTRYYEWQINKVVDDPGPITLQRGESVTVNYTVTVGLLSTTENDWRVQGSITIANPAPMAAELTQVTDVIDSIGSVALSCSGLSVPAGGNLVCTYDSGVKNSPDANPFGPYNTATATQQLYDYDKDLASTDAGTTDHIGAAAINFAEATVSHVDKIITVTDSWYGALGTANALVDTLPKTFTYPRTITASESFCGDYNVDNTATFVTNDTGATGSDDARVAMHVPCEGCTPGFWQGGAGSQLWDQPNDLDWTGNGTNPFIHTTMFNDFFNTTTDSRLDGKTMYALVSTGGTSNSAQRAARDMVAAYLNESAFPGTFPADSLVSLETMWYAAVAGGDAALDNFHNEVSGWNDPPEGGYCPLP